MCGLIAYISSDFIPKNNLIQGLESMAKRGPDGEGIWFDDNVFLGHKRLSIIDLDNRSNQPLVSICERYVVIFNGEIYNYKYLRNLLLDKDISFKTESDTEILSWLYHFFKNDMLPLLRGMFSFVIWDRKEKELFIARDPYGIKPLYFSKTDNGFLVSSQVKSIIATGLIRKDLDSSSIAYYKMLGSIPEPKTLYKNIETIEAGSFVKITNLSNVQKENWSNISEYWLAEGKDKNLKRSLKEASEILRKSINAHLISDAPVAIFLSAGIDSSVLAGVISETNKNIVAITIKYEDQFENLYDESILASEVAKKIGLQHYVRVITKEEFFNDMETILRDMDQPSIDGVNTWYASKAASEIGAKVAISGVGADELFWGYSFFDWLPKTVKIWSLLTKIKLFKNVLRLPFSFINLNNRMHYAYKWMQKIESAWWLKRSIAAPQNCFLKNSQRNNITKDFDPASFLKDRVPKLSSNYKMALSQIESVMYLRNQLLKDADWAGMAHGVEIRTPFVDSKLLSEVSILLPALVKVKKKNILFEALNVDLPNSVYTKPKTGFSIPLNNWLKEKEITWNKLVENSFEFKE